MKNDDKSTTAKRKFGKCGIGEQDASNGEKDVIEKKDSSSTTRCYNCGLKEHVSSNCPTKEKGVKSFRCNQYGHITSKCPSKDMTKSSCAIAQPYGRKHSKDVLIKDIVIQAIIDSGSDITIMRRNQYIKLGSPQFELKVTLFWGVGTEESITIGGFHARLKVDGNCYEVPIHVVANNLSRYKLLICSEFLNTDDVNLRRGKTTIINHQTKMIIVILQKFVKPA